MKRNLLCIFLILCVGSITAVGYAADKKQKSCSEKLSIISSPEFGIVKELIYYHILNGDVISLNLDYYAQKSTVAEDSVPYFKTGFEYLSSQVNQIYSTWDSVSQKWNAVIKDEIYYDTDPWSPDSSIYYDVDTTSGNWLFGRRNIYSYNSDGFESEHMAFIFNDTTQHWDKESKTLSEYNSNKKLISELMYYWSPPDDEWLLLSKDTFVWNGNVQIETESKYWDSFSGTWYSSKKTTMNYDDYDRMEKQVVLNWDYFTNDYKNQWKVVYKYVDASEFIDSAFFFNWDDELLSWTKGAVDIYNYKMNNELIGSIDSYIPLVETKSVSNQESMQKTNTTLYVYNDAATNVVQHNIADILIYPNPIADKVTLLIPDPRNASIEVFNIQGKLIITKAINSPSTTIHTERFKNGLYMFRINNNGEQITKKIIKQ